jgi:hypothetical protein
MAQPVLDRTGADAVIGQLLAATMPQHVEVHRQRQAGALARAPGWHAEDDGDVDGTSGVSAITAR